MINNEIPITATRTEKLLLQKISDLERLMRMVLERDLKNSIEELSLHKTSKLLHVGRNKIIEAIETGELPARKEKHANSKNGITYKIRKSDLYDWQERKHQHLEEIRNQKVELEETSEEMFYKIRKQIVGV